MPQEHESRILDAYRVIRRTQPGDDGPWPGAIVEIASGETVAMIDTDDVGDDWAGWRADPAGHVLAALDIALARAGHVALVPRCSLRLADYLDSRIGSGRALSDGEIVTLVVSLARGYTEAATIELVAGEWWLTDAGRPVLVAMPDAAIDPLSADAVARTVIAASLFPHAWSWIETWPQSRRDLEQTERRAFGVAAPQPLEDVSTYTLSPGVALTQGGSRPRELPDAVAAPASLLQRLVRSVDTDLSDLVSQATTAAWRRLRKPTKSRGRMWAVAGVAAIAALVVGLLWPGSDPATTSPSPEPTATTSAPTGSVDDEKTPSIQPTPEAPAASADDDLAAVVADLLTRRTACEGESACLATVVSATASTFPAGLIDAPPQERRVMLVDDYGGVAVTRVDPNDGENGDPQLVVIQRENDSWLLRDVYAAQQP